MSTKDYLLENETYEDGLKRALRCWDAHSKMLEQVKAENKRLKDGWERLLRLLDTKETNSNGKEFRPTYIASCRLSHTEQVRDLIASVREVLEENNDE